MPYVHHGIGELLKAVFLLAVVMYSCGRFGGFVLGTLNFRAAPLDANERKLFSLATGLMAFSYGILAIGMVGQLSKWNVVILLVAMLFSAAVWGKGRNCFDPADEGEAHGPMAFSLMVVVCVAAFVQAMAPPIGNDALAYHLELPKQWIASHHIGYLPMTRESLWPSQTEMLFTAGLLFQGTMLAQFFHASFYVLTAMAVLCFSRRFFNERAARLAALAFLFTPAAFAQAGHAYVDLSLAFYVFLAVYALLLPAEVGERRAAFLSGLCCGGAMATKYLGLDAAIILFALWIFRSQKKFHLPMIFAGMAALSSGIWYVRSWVTLGSPVYPFFPEVFGAGLTTDISQGVGAGKGLLDFLSLGFNMTFDPASFGGERIGVVFISLLPFLLLLAKRPRKEMQLLTGFIVLYSFLLFRQSPQVRFFLSVVPLLAVGVGAAAEELLRREKLWKLFAVCVLATVFTAHGAYFLYRLRAVVPVAIGQQSAEAYLMKYERSFQGHHYFKESVCCEDKIFNAAEARVFYDATGRLTNDTPSLRHSLGDFAGLEKYLDEQGFAYLWLKEGSDLTDYARSRGYQSVHAYDFTEKPADYNYVIFKKT